MKGIILSFVVVVFTVALYGQDIVEDSVQMEGFYSYGQDKSFFFEIKDEDISMAIWLRFDESFEASDSLKNIIDSPHMETGFYIKVLGIKRTGGAFGNFGTMDTEIVVTKLITVNITRTLSGFIDEMNIEE